MANKPIEQTGEAQDFSETEKAVMLLQTFKEVAAKLVKLPECTKTHADMLRKVYGHISLKLNQGKAF